MPRLHARQVRSNKLHDSVESTLNKMRIEKRAKLTRTERLHIIKTLSEVKSNSSHYDLGEKQTIIVNILLQRARKAKTFDDLFEIHSKTCSLGLEKY